MPASEVLVEEVMVRDIYCVKEGTPMGKVLGHMAQKGVGSAIVVSAQGQFRGIVDGARVVDAIAHEGEEGLVSEVVDRFMKRQIPRLNPRNTLAEATELMDDHVLHYVVVVDGSEPVGVLSHGDIIRWWVGAYSGST